MERLLSELKCIWVCMQISHPNGNLDWASLRHNYEVAKFAFHGLSFSLPGYFPITSTLLSQSVFDPSESQRIRIVLVSVPTSELLIPQISFYFSPFNCMCLVPLFCLTSQGEAPGVKWKLFKWSYKKLLTHSLFLMLMNRFICILNCVLILFSSVNRL